MPGEVRYDPIWRRIKPDKYATALEGAFPNEIDRLEGLNNWGVLAWLHPHATASKAAHHYGVEHVAREFLRADPEREKYSCSLRPAAHFLHIGHTPLSYAGEEAILRAAHVDASVRAHLDEIFDEVIRFGSLECGSPEHRGRCAIRAKEGGSPYELYRWLAAWRLKQRWARVWTAIRTACEDPEHLTAGDVKSRIVKSLVCREDRGYAILGLCNLADYVQRDLLQSGTASLMVDSGALVEENPIGPNAAREWELLRAAQEYLTSRFYASPDALLVHGLAARSTAHALLASGGVSAVGDMIDSYLSDDEFVRSLPAYHRSRVQQVRATARRPNRDWSHIGRFHDVSVVDRPRFAVEDWFTERSGTGKLSYPFNAGLTATISGGSELPGYLAGADRRYVTVDVHSSAAKPRSARYALGVLSKVVTWIGPWDADQVGAALTGWILSQRCDIRISETVRALGLAGLARREVLVRELRALRRMPSVRPLNDHPYAASLADYVIENPDAVPETVGRLILGLPWIAARSSSGVRMLSALRAQCVQMAGETDSGWSRGHALEAAVICDQLLVELPEFRFIAAGTVAIADDGQPRREWDVIRIDLDSADGWSVSAIECAVTPSAQKDAKARESLDELGDALQATFSDVAGYTTLLATVRNGLLEYRDARRGFTR